MHSKQLMLFMKCIVYTFECYFGFQYISVYMRSTYLWHIECSPANIKWFYFSGEYFFLNFKFYSLYANILQMSELTS